MPPKPSRIGFGSSGIRGPYGTRITLELAAGLGRSAGSMADRITVARDARTTGPPLAQAFSAGALSAGADVVELGVAPTPTLAYNARRTGLGVMITASHNPAPDNGFKFWEPDGRALSTKGREQVLSGLAQPPPQVSWDRVGSVTTDPLAPARHARAVQDHVEELVGCPVAPDKGPARVVLDLGNGAAADFSPRLFSSAGFAPVTLNANPDGSFPGRPSEPTAASLKTLSGVVRQTGAPCGVAHDGDADRAAVVDEHGRAIPGDVLLVLLARAVDARRVAVPVNTSQLVWDALPEVRIEVTPVGDAHVSEALARTDGDFGGEPSGAFIFPDVSYCPDGPLAGLLAATLASHEGGLAAPVDALPQYVTCRQSRQHDLEDPSVAMERIASTLSEWGEITDLDGVRVDTEDGWVLVRPSGTEPKVRVTTEARASDRAQDLLDRSLDLVERVLAEVDGS